jgi:hypothetical protein
MDLRSHFPEGVQKFGPWHFFKSNMAAATPRIYYQCKKSPDISGKSVIFCFIFMFVSSTDPMKGLQMQMDQ